MSFCIAIDGTLCQSIQNLGEFLHINLDFGIGNGWSTPEAWGQESEVAWQYHKSERDGFAYTIR